MTDHHIPRVSVVMPVYNGERYLCESIDSIRSQTFEDWEFVIVDDGSSDRSWEILTRVEQLDPRVRLFRNEKNEGLMRALNRGVDEARAPYVARQDADDLSVPTRLEKQVRYLDACPDVAVVGSAFVAIDEEGREMGVQRLPCSHTEIRWRLLFDSAFCHTSVMFRSVTASGGGVRYQSHYCEDYDLWTRMAEERQVANLEESLVHHRVHADTHTVRRSDEQTSQRRDISRREIRRLLPGASLSDEDVIQLHCWYSAFPAVYGPEQFSLCATVLDLLRAFGARADVDVGEWRTIERAWYRRLLDGLPDYRVRQAWRAGLVARLWRTAPGMLATNLGSRCVRRCGFDRRHA